MFNAQTMDYDRHSDLLLITSVELYKNVFINDDDGDDNDYDEREVKTQTTETSKTVSTLHCLASKATCLLSGNDQYFQCFRLALPDHC